MAGATSRDPGTASGSDWLRDPQVVAHCRRVVRQALAEAGREDLTEAAELVTSELVTNALLHGGGCTGFRAVRLEDGVRIEVSDARPQAPVLGLASTASMTGRGLRLAASLCSDLGVEAAADGKVVWAEIKNGA